MIKITSKTRVILGVIIILLALVQSYRLLTLGLDLRASYLITELPQRSDHNLQAASFSPVADPMELIDGLTAPVASEAYMQMYNLAGAGEKNGGAFFAAEESINAWLANVPDIDARMQLIDERLATLLASFPVAAPEPSEMNCFIGALPLYNPTRTTARFWALLAWRAARQGSAQQTLLIACGPAAIGALLEIHETQTGALTGMGKAFGESMGQLSGALLRELAPMLKISREDALQVLKWSETLAKAFPSSERVLANELNFWPVFARNWQKAIDSGEAMKSVGRNPQALVRLCSDQKTLDSYLVPIMTGFRQVCAEPYPQAVQRLKEVLKLVEPLKRHTEKAGVHIFKYVIAPETAFLETILGVQMPNLDTLYIASVKTRAMLRGGALAVALHAFHQEKGSWPADLGEVAAWLGVPSLPQDPFAAAAWTYNASGLSLLSPGPDLQTGSPDDLQFLKVPR